MDGKGMSTKSQAACKAVVLGYPIPHGLIDVKWKSSAIATLDLIAKRYPIDVPRKYDLRQAEILNRSVYPHFVYVAECQSICGVRSVVKVGIAQHVRARETSREKNPLVDWSPSHFVQCGSKAIAEIVECSLLVAAAKRGLWMGHEFVANCDWSKKCARLFLSCIKERQSIGRRVVLESVEMEATYGTQAR